MPTFVGILICIGKVQFHALLSWTWKKFYNPRPACVSMYSCIPVFPVKWDCKCVSWSLSSLGVNGINYFFSCHGSVCSLHKWLKIYSRNIKQKRCSFVCLINWLSLTLLQNSSEFWPGLIIFRCCVESLETSSWPEINGTEVQMYTGGRYDAEGPGNPFLVLRVDLY